MKRLIFLGMIGVLAMAGVAAADIYNIDTAHSTIGFDIKHLMVGTTSGSFNDYQGTIEYDPANVAATKIDATIQAASIDTRNADRDNHLRSADFFDTANYAVITFKSTKVEASGDGYVITGDLTMHGVTKEISIPVSIGGPVQSPFGSWAIGISGKTKINRQDFGIAWNKTLDQGGVVVGDEVVVIVNVEAHKK